MGLEPTNLLTASYFWPTFTHCLELRQSGKYQARCPLSAKLASTFLPLLPRTAGKTNRRFTTFTPIVGDYRAGESPAWTLVLSDPDAPESPGYFKLQGTESTPV